VYLTTVLQVNSFRFLSTLLVTFGLIRLLVFPCQKQSVRKEGI
jgi:hypothetical protein